MIYTPREPKFLKLPLTRKTIEMCALFFVAVRGRGVFHAKMFGQVQNTVPRRNGM